MICVVPPMVVARLSLDRYESLLQLAAALNFAYASLEIILREPLLNVMRDHQILVRAIKEKMSAKDIGQKFHISAFNYNKVKPRLMFIDSASRTILLLNPYVALTLGVMSICELYQSTVCPSCMISKLDGLVMVAICYSWLIVSMLVLLGLRLYLGAFVSNYFKDCRE